MLRLLTLLALATTIRAHAVDRVEFEKELAATQDYMPEFCQIKSDQMKMAFACSGLQGSVQTPRLYTSKQKDDNSYCYNTLVDVKSEDGRIYIDIVRDEPKTTNRWQEYHFAGKEKEMRAGKDGDYKIQLDPMINAGCYATARDAESHCAQKILGFGGSDIPLILSLRKTPLGYLHEPFPEPNNWDEAVRTNGSAVPLDNSNMSEDHVNQMVYAYARQKLIAQAKETLNNPTVSGAEAIKRAEANRLFKRCDEMVQNFEIQKKPRGANDPATEQLLNTYRARLGTPAHAPIPPSGGATTIK